MFGPTGDVPLTAILFTCHLVCLLRDIPHSSRWLPTLLCRKFNKLALNVALGFDTFLVMRHGMTVGETKASELDSEPSLTVRGSAGAGASAKAADHSSDSETSYAEYE